MRIAVGMMNAIRKHRADLAWLGIGLAIIAMAAGSLVFSLANRTFGLSSVVVMALAAGLIAVSLLGVRKFASMSDSSGWYGLSVCIVFLVLSDFLLRATNCLQFESPYLSVLAVFPLALVVAKYPRLIVVILFASVVSCILVFSSASAGRLLFSDDHPSFLYRLTQLKEHFPSIPFYNPYWNGGVEAREFFPSGMLGYFLLWLPVWYTYDVTEVYNRVFALTIFGVTPCALFVAARLARVPTVGCTFSAMLSLLPCLFWYRWNLKYGTVGFLTSCAFYPVALSAGCLLITEKGKLISRYALGALLSVSLVVFWPLGGVALIPLLCLWMFRLPTLLSNWWGRSFVVLGLCIHLPWMLLFLKASSVFSLVLSGVHPAGELATKASTSAMTSAISWHSSLKQLRVDLGTYHPLLLLLSLPGLVKMHSGLTRMMYAVSCLWLLFLGAVVSGLHPTLELDRLLILLSVVLCVPCGAAFAEALAWVRARGDLRLITLRHLAIAIMISAVLLIPFSVRRILNGKSFEQYTFANDQVHQLREALSAYGGEGRTMFAGFILHELSGGHVAPLAQWTGKPLLASRYQHDRWTYVDIIPDDFRARGLEGVLEFLDLYNISTVVTHDRFWRNWYRKHGEHFEQVWQQWPFTIYKRTNYVPSYFLQGRGRIEAQDTNQVRATLDSPEAVLKFAYLPFLEVSGCRIESFQVSGEIRLIRLVDCPVGQELTIRAASPIKRLLGSW